MVSNYYINILNIFYNLIDVGVESSWANIVIFQGESTQGALKQNKFMIESGKLDFQFY